MTRNPITDGQTVLAPLFGSLMNAHGDEAVRTGIDPSVGTGDFDVDTTSGEVVIGNDFVSVGATTTSLTDPTNDADLDSGEFRVDLLTVDTTGSINVAEGVAATEPVTEDIPSDEVVICAVVVSGNASSLQSADIRDYRTVVQSRSPPIFGDGSDGSITRSSNGNENGLIHATDYTLQSGVTRTVSNGVLVIHATDSITINGTLEADGTGDAGASGGSGGARNTGGGVGNAGSNGGSTTGTVIGEGGTAFGGSTSVAQEDGDSGDDGTVTVGGGGGQGGANTDVAGASGGDGQGGSASFNANQRRQLKTLVSASYESIFDLSMLAGAGGGGGGGGGSGAYNNTLSGYGGAGGDGGDGGDGGGVILLLAPQISISGSISADGLAAQTGSDGEDGSGDGGGGGAGGGGAGGSGGLIILVSSLLSNNGTLTVDPGSGNSGGSGGSGNYNGGPGGDGGDGETGLVVKV